MARRERLTQEEYYRGVPTSPYDLVKEITVVLGVMLVVVLILSAVLSSPDQPPVTVQSWARAQPLDFVRTATGELQGTTISADYGPPYNIDADGRDSHDVGGSVQTLGPLAPQVWAGVHQPVDAAQAYVLGPLALASVGRPALAAALVRYRQASAAQRRGWLTAYAAALEHARVSDQVVVAVPAGAYGPLNVIMQALLQDARSGALDSLLVRSGHFYDTNYTGPLLFLGDGNYFPGLAAAQHLASSQWGMTNETGRYPGQSWLWLFTFWYQIPLVSTASNADLMVVLIMGFLSTLLVLVPFIPGLRDLPRWLGLPRLVWREHYRFLKESPPPRPPH
ncbi:MAG: hypothetical protein ACYCX9_04055 [Candidatus Dormibacteria bacterium]|jgi:hypothetical protein